MYKMFFALISLCMPFGVFALGMDVTADIPSGTYHTPIHITLTPTESAAKTFYSFKPDGTPNDALLYTGSVLVKHSTPFIYFSFLNPTNESKIKQNDYIFEYPSTIHFESESISGSGKVDVVLVNSGTESVNIGWWYVQSESDMVTIPEGTMLAAGAKYSIRINYTGNSSIVLRSPDDDERDILIPEQSPSAVGVVLPRQKSVVTKVVPRKIISTNEVPASPVSTPLVPETLTKLPTETSASPEITAPQPHPEAVKVPSIATQDINQIVKVSATESGQKNTNPLYLIILLVISLGIGGFQWFIQKKQK